MLDSMCHEAEPAFLQGGGIQSNLHRQNLCVYTTDKSDFAFLSTIYNLQAVNHSQGIKI